MASNNAPPIICPKCSEFLVVLSVLTLCKRAGFCPGCGAYIIRDKDFWQF